MIIIKGVLNQVLPSSKRFQMAVWQYTLSLVPAESIQDLPPNRSADFLSSFATPDGFDFSSLWGFRQQQAQEVRETITQFLKPTKDNIGVPAYGSQKRSLFILSETDGVVTDFICKIDVRAMQEMRTILTEILSIAKIHKLLGVQDEYGLILLGDAFHLLRSISQSRAVKYVRDPQGYLDHLHETYKLPQSQTPPDASQQATEREGGVAGAESGSTPSEETKIAS
jgi:hypothetical protein